MKSYETRYKYLYDISKGIALLAVVGNIIKDQWITSNLIIGLIAAIGFFIWGYFIDGGFHND